MTKPDKPNQRGKSGANGAKLKPVSARTRTRMAKQIAELNAPPHEFTYEQISAAMGHESGYAHLIQHGGRVSPTRIEQQALEAMHQTAKQYAHLFSSDVNSRVEIIGLLAQAMRKVNEL